LEQAARNRQTRCSKCRKDCSAGSARYAQQWDGAENAMLLRRRGLAAGAERVREFYALCE